MLFNSLEFCAFFVVVTLLYYGLPWAGRWKMLLAASCIFYVAFVPAYIVVLFTTIVIDYAMGIRIAGSEGRRRKRYLIFSIVSTCLVLFVFKYYNFFACTAGLPLAKIILPIGLSFHTFQSLSYVIEVYRGRQAPERNFGIYSLYVMFYPQLVAGPIERPQNLLHQFYLDHRFDANGVLSGLASIGWGFFKKMVIADRCAAYVNNVYGTWETQSGLALAMATGMFAIQIYADFSGYSAIAIGCARVMGFDLMRNFRHPYFAGSVSEFWTRWHISLSTWFKDYVYIPLGGSRSGTRRHYLNLLITFTVSGLWHGANWTFVAWGFYNGALLVVESAAARVWLRDGGWLRAVRRAVTLAAVNLGWVFFRAPSLGAASGILRRMFTGLRLDARTIQDAVLQATHDNTSAAFLMTTGTLVFAMLTVEYGMEIEAFGLPKRFALSARWQAASIVATCQTVLLFGVLRASSFIYFQF